MTSLKNFILPLFKNKRGKPRFLNKLILLSTSAKFKHKWASKNLEKDDVVLDVGARSFPYTCYQDVKAVFGIDLPSESEGYLGFNDDINENFSNGTSIFPILGNCEEMPFGNDSFDKILMIEVIEHVERDELAISELARVLKKEGKLLLTTPNGVDVKKTNPYHIRHYHPNNLKLLLEKYFHEVEIQLKFPNHDLVVRQYLPQNIFLPKKVFWRYIYEIWHFMRGKKYSDNGYTIAARCSLPKNTRSGESSSFDYFDIVACPNCREKLEEKRGKDQKNKVLYCKHCDASYPFKKGTPFLLTNIPHHQVGPPSYYVEDWKHYNKNKDKTVDVNQKY